LNKYYELTNTDFGSNFTASNLAIFRSADFAMTLFFGRTMLHYYIYFISGSVVAVEITKIIKV
jgi:hypothetical protein